MLHFAHFEKQAECIGRRKYLLRINYDLSDEAEMVIRILSFGPMVRVLEPSSFVDTYNNWGKSSDIIDYIYYTGFSSCSEYQTVTKKYADRKFVSDHFPITALLVF